MKPLLYTSITLLCTLTATAAPLPEGWNVTHWGMPATEITTLYPSAQEAPKPDTFRIDGRDYSSRLSLQNVAIGQDSFTARFLTGMAGTLAGVQLSSNRDTPEKTLAAYERIKAALVQKYSQPANEGVTTPDARTLDPSSKQAVWEDAHSRITLEYVASKDASADPYLILCYMQLDPTQSVRKDGNL